MDVRRSLPLLLLGAGVALLSAAGFGFQAVGPELWPQACLFLGAASCVGAFALLWRR